MQSQPSPNRIVQLHPGRTQLQRKLAKLRQDVLRMGALVEHSVRLSHRALFECDLEAANSIAPLDKKIDKFYRQIEADCVMLLTLESPVAHDSRQLGALMQLIRDLERIGDYAKDLGAIAMKLFPYPKHPCMSDIERMSREAQAMLAMGLAAVVELDGSAGPEMKKRDTIVDNAYKSLYRRLAYQENFQGILEPIVLMTLIIRHLERMADHATNIGQRVTYIVTGQRGS
ncbi:MAG: phosphate signaling complex protein PhoU [Geitlerinemataceae cyanobacterium]